MAFCDSTFDAMGCAIRIVIGDPEPGLPAAGIQAEECRAFIEDFDRRLSRFRSDSELSALNRDPRGEVPASALLRRAVAAGVGAARRTDGLIDPTLLAELERAGYATSRAGVEPAPLREALAAAPPRRPARPSDERRWSTVEVDEAEATIRRPAGVLIDTGGTGKGLAADMLAERLEGYSHFIVDCGGDIRLGGRAASSEQPFEIEVEHPLTRARNFHLRLSRGGVATSGVDVRLWRDADGNFAHHLIDPSTGEPAWTGLVGVTALGPTTLEAETISKAALLSGPEGARDLLSRYGGLMVHESGRVERAGRLAGTPRVTLPALNGAPASQLDLTGAAR